MKTVRVALDTNFLVWTVKQKVNACREIRRLLGRVEFVVPAQVERELGLLRRKGKTMEKLVNLAEMELKANEVKVIGVNAANADDALVGLALDGCWVATNDRALKARLKERIIFIRQNKLVEAIGEGV
ncbi:MAG TPA: hypothetical protein HA252_02400 [Candidatus Diapherotrites archaeon]|uniref:VapC9 PIN-like domain-containing protein n=1 Tax=Candidatus Iainarchaeum sp. TaxID=3101447 RepID=A0A7J4JEQ1_9ARCH|nr:hypothetical protein [Candidatus Diapherotrites archaeon]HIH16233.1 hypothetical protein [Candidatus Diapherotrites archaeon]